MNKTTQMSHTAKIKYFETPRQRALQLDAHAETNERCHRTVRNRGRELHKHVVLRVVDLDVIGVEHFERLECHRVFRVDDVTNVFKDLVGIDRLASVLVAHGSSPLRRHALRHVVDDRIRVVLLNLFECSKKIKDDRV